MRRDERRKLSKREMTPVNRPQLFPSSVLPQLGAVTLGRDGKGGRATRPPGGSSGLGTRLEKQKENNGLINYAGSRRVIAVLYQ